jgi:phospholipase/carboxylesterase
VKLKFMQKVFLLSILFLYQQLLFSQKLNSNLTYLVQEPLKKSDKPPVLIMLHGYGSNESDLFAMAQGFDERYLVLSVRGPLNVKNMGYAWYDLNFLPNKKITHNFEQAKKSSEKLKSFISEACKVYKADSTKIILMGFSQGAILAIHMGLSYPGKIYGVMALSGRMMEESKTVKTDSKKLQELKVFLAHGYSDNVIDYKEALKAHEFLKEKQIKNLSFKSYEMPHSINGEELKDIQAWLKKHAEPEMKK